MKMDAVFDVTKTYRYSLWREWNPNAPCLGFIMLNPSTADKTTNDPTIRRCIGFAKTWGYGSLEVVNLFAYCTKSPQDLRRAVEPIGIENERYLLQAGQRAKTMILAWGNWGKLQNRSQEVLNLLSGEGELYCLGCTQSGQPRHPLYVKGNTHFNRYFP